MFADRQERVITLTAAETRRWAAEQDIYDDGTGIRARVARRARALARRLGVSGVSVLTPHGVAVSRHYAAGGGVAVSLIDADGREVRT